MNAPFRAEKAHSINGVPGRLGTLHVPPLPWVDGVFANQSWISELRSVQGYGPGAKMRVNIRFDDNCKNGHMTFAITADVDKYSGGVKVHELAGGCMHDEIAQAFPELAPLIKWHLVSTDGPMHYVANTCYHALQHGANRAWVYYTGPIDPLKLGGLRERLLCYSSDVNKIKEAEDWPGYRVQWDEKTIKVQNLDYARSSACWPEATDEQLSLPKEELTALLLARLPGLMAEFRADVEKIGFLWEAPNRNP